MSRTGPPASWSTQTEMAGAVGLAVLAALDLDDVMARTPIGRLWAVACVDSLRTVILSRIWSGPGWASLGAVTQSWEL